MKENPAQQPIRDRLEPGAISLEGFLGKDKRPLNDIIAADLAELETLGVTHEELGAFLERLHTVADSGWESSVPLYDGKIMVRDDETMGQIPCPFACGAHCHKAVVEVSDSNDNLILTFTPLDAHLIREHGFFQGKGATYRIEPAELVALYRRCIST